MGFRSTLIPGSSPSLGKLELPGCCFFMSITTIHRFFIKLSLDWPLLHSETDRASTAHLTLTPCQTPTRKAQSALSIQWLSSWKFQSSWLFPQNNIVILSQQQVLIATGRRRYPTLLHATTGRRCIQRYMPQKSKNQDTTAVCKHGEWF